MLYSSERLFFFPCFDERDPPDATWPFMPFMVLESGMGAMVICEW